MSTQSRHRPSVAIIGGGISGLICAQTLMQHQINVTVFDKGRRPGGRMATRQREGYQFDHGAQYFTVRDARFQHAVDAWRQQGCAEIWTGRVCTLDHGDIADKPASSPRYVGTPGMNAIGQHLASSCDVRRAVQIDQVWRDGHTWRLRAETGETFDGYDGLVITTPAPQAVPFLAEAPHLASQVAAVKMTGCWAVMLAFPKPLDLPFDAAFVVNSPLSWVARDSSKPQRVATDCWVLHASPEWSETHIEQSPDWIMEQLLRAFWQMTGHAAIPPHVSKAHRWRFALPEVTSNEGYLFDPELAIGGCGDWCHSARIEGAFMSGLELANRMREIYP